MKRFVLLVGVGLLLCAGSAQAVTIDGPAQFQRWADHSHVPTAEVTVKVTADPCPIAPRREYQPPGCAYPGLIFGTGLTRQVFLHELGHQFDDAHAPDFFTDPNGGSPLRAAYERIQGVSGPWWGSKGIGEDDGSPGEMFATQYEHCAEDPPGSLRFADRDLKRTCALIRRVG